MDNKRKRQLITVGIAFILFLILSISYINRYARTNIDGRNVVIKNWEQYITDVSGYIETEDGFIVNSEDPHITLELHSDEDVINGICIETEENVDTAQIYYYNDKQGIDEVYSQKYANTKIIEFIGNDEWNSFRIDVDDDFKIKEVKYITDATVSYESNWWRYALAILINIVVAFLMGYIDPIGVIFYPLFQNEISWKKMMIFIALSIAGVIIAYILENLIVHIENFDYINPYRRFAVFAILEVIVLLVIFKKDFISELHLLAFAIIILLGIVNIYATPIEVGVSWDDELHYARVVYIAEGMTGEGELRELRLIEKYANNIWENNIYSRDERIQSNNEGEQLAQIYGNKTKKLTVDGWHIYSFPYLPAATGMYVGKLFNLGFGAIFKLGKLFNLIFYAFIISLAIKILESKGKMLCMAIALLPTNIFLASNYSYDAWVISLVILSYSLLYNAMLKQDKVSLKTVIEIMIIGFIGILPKAVYIVLFIPMLFVPKRRLKKPVMSKLVALCGIICGLATFVLPMLFNVATGTSSGDIRGGTGVNATEQLIYVMHHPFKYSGVLFKFLTRYLAIGNIEQYTTSFAYYGIGICGVLCMIIVLFISFIDNSYVVNEKNRINVQYRLSVVIVGMLTIMFVATTFYLAFTTVAGNTIEGCQNRYMLPVLFPGLFCLFDNRIRINVKIKKSLFILCIFALCLIYTINIYNLLIVLY